MYVSNLLLASRHLWAVVLERRGSGAGRVRLSLVLPRLMAGSRRWRQLRQALRRVVTPVTAAAAPTTSLTQFTLIPLFSFRFTCCHRRCGGRRASTAAAGFRLGGFANRTPGFFAAFSLRRVDEVGDGKGAGPGDVGLQELLRDGSGAGVGTDDVLQ